MLDSLFNNPLGFLFWLAAIAIAITIHEFSHAWMADRLGDPTARLAGRLTLNPRAHLDFWGTLLLIVARFGWGKPVPVDPYNLRNPRRDNMLISLSGPASNLILATVCSLILRLTFSLFINNSFISLSVYSFISLLISMNIMLAVFNLIPIHPLDGFKIVEGLLPEEKAKQWAELESYGTFFLIVLIFPIFGRSPIISLISPIINFLTNLLLPNLTII